MGHSYSSVDTDSLALNEYIAKEDKSQINNISSHLKNLEKNTAKNKQQQKKASRRR